MSRQKMSITSWLSTPSCLHTLPISLAKHTLSACQVLLVYFIISATRMLVLTSGASIVLVERRWSRRRRPRGCGRRASSAAGGSRAARVPSRRNSGFTATPKPSPYFLPELALERRDHDLVRRARQHRAADDDHVVAGLPRPARAPTCSRDAVEIGRGPGCRSGGSACRRTASETSRVRRPRPPVSAGGPQPAAARRPVFSSSSRPGSTIGLRPALMLRHLVVVDVDADDRVAVGRELRRRHTTDISESEYRHVHDRTSREMSLFRAFVQERRRACAGPLGGRRLPRSPPRTHARRPTSRSVRRPAVAPPCSEPGARPAGSRSSAQRPSPANGAGPSAMTTARRRRPAGPRRRPPSTRPPCPSPSPRRSSAASRRRCAEGRRRPRRARRAAARRPPGR